MQQIFLHILPVNIAVYHVHLIVGGQNHDCDCDLSITTEVSSVYTALPRYFIFRETMTA